MFRSSKPPADEGIIVERHREYILPGISAVAHWHLQAAAVEASIDCVISIDDQERFQALLDSSETCVFHFGPYEYVLQKEETKRSKVINAKLDEETGHVVFECEVYGISHVVRATSLCTTYGQPSLKNYVAVFLRSW